MSSANAGAQRVSLINKCVQCSMTIVPELSRRACHAIPCGHVVCSECCERLLFEEKSGEASCNSPGCQRIFESLFEWPVAMCIQRGDRIRANGAGVFGDQGNVGGDRLAEDATCGECGPDEDTGKPHPATHRCTECNLSFCSVFAESHRRGKTTRGHTLTHLTPPPKPPQHSMCAEHNERVVMAEVGTHKLVCLSCVSKAGRSRNVESLEAALKSAQADLDSQTIQAAQQEARLLELKINPDEYRAGVDKWAGEETARIRLWEEREVKAVHAAAGKSVALVEEVRVHRLEVGMGILAQRLGLAASLHEADAELKGLSADNVEERLAKTLEVTAELKALLALLAQGTLDVASSEVYAQWARLPSLELDLDGKRGFSPPHSSTALSNVEGTLRYLPLALPSTRFWREAPVLRPLVSRAHAFRPSGRVAEMSCIFD